MGTAKLAASHEVRIATPSDLAGLRAVDPLLRNHDRAESVRNAVEQGCCLAASVGDQVAGYAVLNRSFFRQAFVELLVVGSAHRRLGLGMLLLNEAENRCSQKKLFTSCSKSNLPAQRLFEKCGFQRSGQIYNLDADDPELVYFKDLSPSSELRPSYAREGDSDHAPVAKLPADRLPLGEFVLDRAAGELLTATGQLAGLRKQALDVLVLLGRRAGQVVSKDELIRQVWPNVVVGEGSLTQAIADIRRVLGDSEHRVIRNVARRGYMLSLDPMPVGSIERTDGGATPSSLARAPLPRDVPPLSIVVLPLAIEGEAKGMEWFADALHGDLVIEVARLHHSLVIARDTAATYKGKAVDPRQVARELGVRHVVRGSLRQEDQKILLNLELIVGETGVLQWAETFSIDRARLQQTLGDFAVAIERTLAGELFRSVVERRRALSPIEVTADDLAMQGYAIWYRGVTRENVLAALALFERAVVMDPDSARAWAGINFTTINILLNNWTADRAAAKQRIEEASAQLERVDRDGHYTQQAIALKYLLKRDFPAMLRHTTTWIDRYRLPVAFGAHALALNLNGRFDEAVLASERALRLGPRDPYRAEWQYGLALAHFGAKRYELSRDWSETAAATNAALLWPPIHAAALYWLEDLDAAQSAFDEHMCRHPSFTASQVMSRLPSDEPLLAEARERLVASLRQLGMRE